MAVPLAVRATLLLAVATAQVASYSEAPALYRIKQLEWQPQGSTYVSPAGINDAGQVIGNHADYRTTPAVQKAYLWNGDGPPIELGVLPGHSSSRAIAINNRGQIIGLSKSAPWEGTEQTAFLYDPITGLQAIGPRFYPGSRTTPTFTPASINDEGVVLGTGRLPGAPAGTPEHVLLWTAATGLIDPHPGSSSNLARSLNNLGDIVFSQVYGVNLRGWYWAPGGEPVNMGYVKGMTTYRETTPIDINNSGSVVGTSGGTGLEGFIWDSSQGMRSLGTLGCSSSYPEAINDAGVVVGHSCKHKYGLWVPFIWSQANGMRPLAGLIDPEDPLRTLCSRYVDPVGINNRNEIVGYCGSGGYYGGPFVLVPVVRTE